MRAVALVVALAFTVASALLGADAQQTKVPRIGFLYGGSAGAGTEAFRHKLRDLGYVEGQSVALEWRFADGRYDRLPNLAMELVRLRVDIIVATGIAAATAAKSTTPHDPHCHGWRYRSC